MSPRLERVERVARAFHEEYERAAPEFGYDTRPESAVPWERVPAANRGLMRAVVARLLADGVISCPRMERSTVDEILEAISTAAWDESPRVVDELLDELRQKMEAQRDVALVAFYRADPVACAKLCDGQLDRTGGLLGRVREWAGA